MTHLEEYSNEEDIYIHSLMGIIMDKYSYCTANRDKKIVRFYYKFREDYDYSVICIPKSTLNECRINNTIPQQIKRIVMNDNEFKLFSRARKLIEVIIEKAASKIDGTVMIEIREHLIQMKQVEEQHNRKVKSRHRRCKCKGGATGRTVTADFEYQICDTCGGLFG